MTTQLDTLYATPDPARALCAWALAPCRLSPVPDPPPGKRCACGAALSARNRSGQCPRCYQRTYMRRWSDKQRQHARVTPAPIVTPRRPTLRVVGQPIPIVDGDGVHCGICGVAAPPLTAGCCASCWALVSTGRTPAAVRAARRAEVGAA